MKTIFISIFIFFIAFSSGYTQVGHTINNWQSIQYGFSYSAVPAPYYYYYTITITPDRTVKLKYILGYDEKKDPVYNYEYSISKKKFTSLKMTITKSKVLTEEMKSVEFEESLVGGTSEHIEFLFPAESEGGTQDTILYYNLPTGKYKENFQKLYSFIINLIPKSTWTELEQIRENYKKRK